MTRKTFCFEVYENATGYLPHDLNRKVEAWACHECKELVRIADKVCACGHRRCNAPSLDRYASKYREVEREELLEDE